MTALSKIGKYEVQGLLGEGAMGVVYRALDPMLNRYVAVKVMNDAFARDEDFRTRFLREARAAGSLQHPNVVTVYDCGEVDGHLYIAMEYVDGTDLETLMAGVVPLTLPSKVEIVIGVLNGLAYAHKRGIVHRDVKPANIRVNEEGRALIMDFGIAHTSSSNMTRTGMMIGTPNYMAPEQVLGGAVTPQTDIFAVGVVLYELLTNTKPFDGENLHSVLYKIVSEPPAPPEKLVTGLRADLAEIVMKALAKDSAGRYTSALDMANALSIASAAISGMGRRSGSKTLSLRSAIEAPLLLRREEEGKVRRLRMWRLVRVAAAVALLLGGALVVLYVRDTSRKVSAPVVRSASNVAKPPVPTVVSKENAEVVAPRAPPSSLSSPPPSIRAALASPTASNTDTSRHQRDPSIAQSLRASAQQSRRRAVEAGASAAQLVRGDKHHAAAEQALTKGLGEEASREFAQAASAWDDAETVARRGAGASTITAEATPPKMPAVVGVAPSMPTTLSPPEGNPSVEIAATVMQYAKAIESRDVGELRRLYPRMSSSQGSAFEDFFRSVQSLRAVFSLSNLQVEGTSAEAKLNGTYDFVTPSGRSEHQALTLQAVLHKEASGWRFLSIR